jgi:hypothetical protein
MDTGASRTNPNLFTPLPVFSDEINRKIVRSEVEGGVYLKDLPHGSELEIETENRAYRIIVQTDGRILISGHPQFCPSPIPVSIHGSSWGGSMLKVAYIGRGMHLEFRHPEYRTITTSRIREIRAVA